MPSNDEIMREAGRNGGAVKIFTDRDIRSHVKNIKCPLHHAVIPGRIGYKIEPNPTMKHLTNDMCQKFGLKKWRYKKDRYGKKIPDYRNHYQPDISAAYARERIYTMGHPVCRNCRRCII